MKYINYIQITYDYKFTTKEKTVCNCGSSNCRGYLGCNLKDEYLKDNNIIKKKKEKLQKKKFKKIKTDIVDIETSSITSASISPKSEDVIINE